MQAEFSILFAHPPGAPKRIPIGIILTVSEELLVRVRTQWDLWPLEPEYLSGLGEELVQLGRLLGAHKLVSYLKETLSHSVQIGDGELLETDDPTEEFDRLYRLHIDSEA